MNTTTLEIRQMPTTQLQPAPYNPRRLLKPGDPAWRKLERSLLEFGLVEPLIWNQQTGHVVGGHLRLRILQHHVVDAVPVAVVDLSPEREKALNILLNNKEAQGRYDPDLLQQLLGELEALPELELTGFDAGTLRNLRLQPLAELPALPARNQVEVALEMPAEIYPKLESELDALVRKFDLVCHVRPIT
jgi:ParB-like chromosome segregation protein Spo0J